MRKKVVSKYKKFKRQIENNNRIAVSKGYESYHSLKAMEYGVTKEAYELAFSYETKERFYEIAKELFPEKYRGILPLTPSGYPNWRLMFGKINPVPFEEIYLSIDPKRKYRSRIKLLRERYEGAFYASWDAKTKTAELFVPKDLDITDRVDIQEGIYIAHEIGHCISYIKWMDEGTSIPDIPKFTRELVATEAQRGYISNVSKRYRNLFRLTELWEYVMSLVEKEMYEDPKQDFFKLYARLVNKYFFTNLKTNSGFLKIPILMQGDCIFLIFAAVYSSKK